jgi:hypothetical protein
MNRIRINPALFARVLVAAFAFSSAALAGPPVTFESLLGEMTDRDARATFPAPHYASLLASSYNRLSSDSRYQLATEPADERWIGEHPIAHGAAGKKGEIC